VFVGVFTPLQVLFVALRFYARSLASASWGWDDGLVIAALLGQLVFSGIVIGAVQQTPVGYHMDYISETKPEAAAIFFKYSLIIIPAWYFATAWTAKFAICIFLGRIFPQRSVKRILIAVGAVLMCSCIGCFIANLAACKPFSAHWGSQEERNAHCMNKSNLYTWGTFPNILTDIALLVLPLPIIRRLHTSIQMKVALAATFLIGIIGLVASIMRFSISITTRKDQDYTWDAVKLIVWSVVELGIYLISACMLALRPLLDKFIRGSFRISINPMSTYDQHLDKDGEEPNHQISHDADIVLGSNINQGFKRLTDDCSDELPPPRRHTQSQFPQIRVTTNIEQSWDKA
jgi:hypothetical protein